MNRWTRNGLIGTVVTALCCFTPLLVWVFAGLGFAAAVPWIDPVLLPFLGISVVLMIWGVTRKKA
jgi:mercuric ion transport protein